MANFAQNNFISSTSKVPLKAFARAKGPGDHSESSRRGGDTQTEISS